MSIFEAYDRDATVAILPAADGSITAAKLAAGAVTGPKIAVGALKTLQFTGRATNGTITVQGVGATDVIVSCTNLTDGGLSSAFSVTGSNQLTQGGGVDLSNKTFQITIKPAA